jgi:hypothetical protein
MVYSNELSVIFSEFSHAALRNFLLFKFPEGQRIFRRARREHVGLICLREPGMAFWLVGCNFSITILVLCFLIMEAFWNKNQAKNWTFWICAFANNQLPGDVASFFVDSVCFRYHAPENSMGF